MASRNPLEILHREMTPDEAVQIDDVFQDAADLMSQLIKLESFCDPRCLALARTNLEQCVLWVQQAHRVSQL